MGSLGSFLLCVFISFLRLFPHISVGPCCFISLDAVWDVWRFLEGRLSRGILLVGLRGNDLRKERWGRHVSYYIWCVIHGGSVLVVFYPHPIFP